MRQAANDSGGFCRYHKDKSGSAGSAARGQKRAADETFMDAKVSEHDVAAAQPAPLGHREKTIIVIAMMSPEFLGTVDQSILAPSLPTIGRALGDVHNLPWLITAYLIASTALTPLYGKFADIHGRRVAMLIALGIYIAGCMLAASSSSMLMLIA